MVSHEIDYKIFGDDIQFVEIGQGMAAVNACKKTGACTGAIRKEQGKRIRIDIRQLPERIIILRKIKS